MAILEDEMNFDEIKRAKLQSNAEDSEAVTPDIFEEGSKAVVPHMYGGDAVQPEAVMEELPPAATAEAVVYKPIGPEEVAEATALLQKYKAGKSALEERIKSNEEWWRLRNWEHITTKKSPSDLQPSSAWLFNSVANKHADMMDNFPSPNILPRAQDDEADAKMLSAIIPVILEQNGYEQTYDENGWRKLIGGSCCTGVFWNNDKLNGLGDVDIRPISLLSVFWEPGVNDIQDSPNFFSVEMVDSEILRGEYPQLKIGSSNLGLTEYIHDDTKDDSNKTAVVDWYYKRRNGSKTILHYCKFCCGEVLYASENEPEYSEEGYYWHGLYPFDIDYCFPVQGSPCGFGQVDIMKDTQMYIDLLDANILKNALLKSRPRYMINNEDPNFNAEEFADWTKDFVRVAGNIDEQHYKPIDTPDLPGVCVQVRTNKIEELKETSGNRDFSQGGTTSGVTSGSAIAALQEAGNKLSRDQIRSNYRSYVRIIHFVIELVRQFYTEPRSFRITGEGGDAEYIRYSNEKIAPRTIEGDFGGEAYTKQPIFDIKVKAQKRSSFSREVENERAKELYAAGFFNPQMTDQALCALDMMDFEGIDKVKQRIGQNGTMFQQIQMLQQQVIQLANVVKVLQGGEPVEAEGGQNGVPAPPSTPTKKLEAGGLGESVDKTNSHQAEAMRKKVQSGASPT